MTSAGRLGPHIPDWAAQAAAQIRSELLHFFGDSPTLHDLTPIVASNIHAARIATVIAHAAPHSIVDERDIPELARLVRIYLAPAPAAQLAGDLSRSKAADRDPAFRATMQRLAAALHLPTTPQQGGWKI